MTRIALIDLSSIHRRYWHAPRNEDISTAIHDTVQAVHEYATGFDHVGVCVDRPPYKRRELLPSYKQNRDKTASAVIDQVRTIEERLDADGFHVFGAEGYEADDIIAKLALWAEEQDHEVVIFSSDKDLMQLIDDWISVISIATREHYDADAVRAKFGVHPEQIPDLLALVGDASDNVPGIHGVGIKTAAKWLEEHGGLDAILADPSVLPEKWANIVAENRDNLSKAWRLVTLMTDAPINLEEIMQDTDPQEAVEPEIMEAPPEAAQEMVPEKSTALVAADPAPPEWDKALEPRSMESAWALANGLYKSRIFGEFPNPHAILAVVMTGRSMGLDAVASLRGFHVIKGRVSPSAQVLIGLVKRHPECIYFRLVSSDDKEATWETHRKGEPEATRMSYTMQDAQMAGLVSNDNWKKRPKTMLRWRAGVELARAVYPDITTGLYTPDEIEEM